MVLSGDKEKVSAGFVPAFSSHTSLREWVIGRLDKHKQTTTGVILGHGRLILWYRWPRGGHWNMWLCFTHSQSWQCSGISDFFLFLQKFQNILDDLFEWTIQKKKDEGLVVNLNSFFNYMVLCCRKQCELSGRRQCPVCSYSNNSIFSSCLGNWHQNFARSNRFTFEAEGIW